MDTETPFVFGMLLVLNKKKCVKSKDAVLLHWQKINTKFLTFLKYSTLHSIFLSFERPTRKKINSLGSEFLLTAKSILACLDPLK